ncbi:suppressor of fused domain protein [Paenibacillus sp. N1-5-1-14]|uniref:suppressor of fused domain protein n=1 Tax=Paenibacillus radicibacter TaxID=2972488 RepID=UPI0021594420|nr:suppressor of fused domain protein [Paenibacillus radicibacter]MCR8645493.1 suppressor of fused domain protein [Paenibacillus radicibacter]
MALNVNIDKKVYGGNMSQEMSKSGVPIYRHSEREEEFDYVTENEQTLHAVSNHVEKHIGKISNVFHEIISPQVHLDVLIVNPTKERDYYTLVTAGMSNLPMNVPNGAEKYKFAELMIYLPSNWPVGPEAFNKEENYWPIYWLKKMARLPHEFNTWLYLGHTVPNGDPAKPFASNTSFSGMILNVPTLVEDLKSFFTLSMPNESEVHFFSLIPLYKEEMDLKLKSGTEILFEKLEKSGVNEIINIKRKNVAKKAFLFF